MAITNITKPTTTLANSSKVVNYETWDSNTSTWDTETRTWDEMGTTWANTTLENVSYLWGFNSNPWQYALPWQVSTGITNINRP